MADYDASVRICTKIDTEKATAQLLSLENRMLKAGDKVSELNRRMKELEGRKTPTEEYAQLQIQLAKSGEELKRLIDRQNELESIGIRSGSAWNSINNEVADTAIHVDDIKEKMYQLESAGKAFTIGSDTEEYSRISRQLTYAENSLKVLELQHENAIGKMEGSEQSFGQKSASIFRKIAAAAGSAFSKAASVANKVLTKTSDIFHKIGNTAKRVFQKLHSDTGKQNSLLSTMKSRLGGIALSLLVFNWISKGFNAMITGMKEGLRNLAKYSREYNGVMSEMVSALATLKNAFATAFAPIASVAIPYLTQLINWLTTAVNKVAQFISALTGKTTWTKAKKQTIDYAGSLDKVSDSAKKAYNSLASFDELNVLNKREDTDAGAGGINPSDMFEEVPIDSGIKKLADKIKAILKTDDWSEIGRMIADKLNTAMRRIPWYKIKAEARRIASGIATLLNGFIGGLDWTLFGYTLAQGLNTALIFLNTFAEKFDWKLFGESLSEGINSLVGYIDWKLLGESVKNWWNGIIDFLYELIVGTDWKNLGSSIGDSFNVALEGIDWMHTAEMLGEGINAVFEYLLGLGRTIHWEQIGFETSNFLNEGFAAIDAEMAGESVRTWIDGIFQSLLIAVKNTDWGAVGRGFSTFVNESILYADWGQIGKTLSEVAKGFLEFLIGSIDTLDWEQVGRDMVDLLVNIDWLGLFARLLIVITEAIFGLKDGVRGAFYELAEYLPDGFLKGIIDGLLDIDKWIDEHIVTPFVTGVKALFGIHSPSTVMAEIGEFLITGLIKGISDAKSYLLDALNNIYDTVTGIMEKIMSFVSGIVESVTSKVSSIKNSISNAIGLKGSAGKNTRAAVAYSGYQMPELATGGVTTGMTIAKIGEAGREAVLPLENNTGWMDTLAQKINSSGTITVVAELDGDVVFRKTVEKNDIFRKQNGHSAYAY